MNGERPWLAAGGAKAILLNDASFTTLECGASALWFYVDHAALHHEVHFLEVLNVAHGIAWYGDNVSELAGFQRANFVSHAE